MNISINIPDKVDATLRRKAAALGENLNEYLQRVVVEEAEEELPSPPTNESTESFMTRLREMIERHGIRSGHVDDSRDSIYAGCRE